MGVSLTNHKLPNIYNHVYPSYLSWCFSLDLSNDWFITQTHHTVNGRRNKFSPYTLQPPPQQESQPASQLSPIVAKKHGTITMNNLSLPAFKFLLVYILPLCTAKRTLKTLWSVFALESLEEPEEQHMTSFCPPKIVKRECRLRRCCCFSGLTKRCQCMKSIEIRYPHSDSSSSIVSSPNATASI